MENMTEIYERLEGLPEADRQLLNRSADLRRQGDFNQALALLEKETLSDPTLEHWEKALCRYGIRLLKHGDPVQYEVVYTRNTSFLKDLDVEDALETENSQWRKLLKKEANIIEDYRREAVYQKALQMSSGSAEDRQMAVQLLTGILPFRDAAQKIKEIKKDIKTSYKASLSEEDVKKKRKIKKTAIIGVAVILIACLITSLVIFAGPYIKIAQAQKNIENGNIDQAIHSLKEMDSVPQAFSVYRQAAALKAKELESEGQSFEAALLYQEAAQYQNAEIASDCFSRIHIGTYLSAAIGDREAYYISDYPGDNAEKGLTAVQQMKYFISAGNLVAGKDSSGNLIVHNPATGGDFLAEKNADIDRWNHVVQILVDGENYYGLTDEGNVLTLIGNEESQVSEISEWNNIVSLTLGHNKIFGIGQDGSVLVGYPDDYMSSVVYLTQDWKNVVKVEEIASCLIGLTDTGTLLVDGLNLEIFEKDLLKQEDVVDLSYCRNILALLKTDGTIETCLVNIKLDTMEKTQKSYYQEILDELNQWRQIIVLKANASGFMGLDVNREVHYKSADIWMDTEKSVYKYTEHSDVLKDIKKWSEPILAFMSKANTTQGTRDASSSWVYAIGLGESGQVYATGRGTYFIEDAAKKGSYHLVDEWKLWEQ